MSKTTVSIRTRVIWIVAAISKATTEMNRRNTRKWVINDKQLVCKNPAIHHLCYLIRCGATGDVEPFPGHRHTQLGNTI